ncbi:hypothetical protein [Rhizobium sp. RCC_161_2]|uniref:hypothetical protein n=1 Tax=Rhizobium sp. RCC_161_2 TaxID=3239219 RepID=UPI003524A3C2
MPSFEPGKYCALIIYIVMIVVIACILVAGVLTFRERATERPGQPSPHALDQSQ